MSVIDYVLSVIGIIMFLGTIWYFWDEVKPSWDKLPMNIRVGLIFIVVVFIIGIVIGTRL